MEGTVKVFCDVYGDRNGLSAFITNDKKVLAACDKAEKVITKENKKARKELEVLLNSNRNKRIVPFLFFFSRKPKNQNELMTYSGVKQTLNQIDESCNEIKNRINSIRSMFKLVDGNELYLDASDSRFVSMWNSYDPDKDEPLLKRVDEDGYIEEI